MITVRSKSADLFVAISSRDVGFVSQILDEGADINCVMRLTTPLYFAICQRMIEMCRLLISRGANVNHRGSTDKQMLEPPLVAACRMNLVEIAKILLEVKYINVDQVDFFGYSAIYYAAGWSNRELVAGILELGANINVSTRHANCPLHLTAVRQPSKRGNFLSRYLIQGGCHVDQALFSSLVRSSKFDLFELALRASCRLHGGTCAPTKELWNKWQIENKRFKRWLEENKEFLEIRPQSLKANCVSAIRIILIRNCKNIRRAVLDRLPIPEMLKNQVWLVH